MIGLRPIAVALALLPSIAMADVIGQARVIDGDTLDIHGERIRLHGIDAPESSQLCTLAGEKYRCGQEAAMALADKIGRHTVACQGVEKDRYGRTVAICRMGCDEDLNAWLVAHGLALAYRQYSIDYVTQEDAAKAAGLGMWQGEFLTPAEWRAGKR